MNKIGSRNLPIAIEDDIQEEQVDDITQKLDEARNKSIIQEAQFTSEPLQLCFAVVKTLIEGDITVKQRELNKAILQYFKDQVGKNMVMEHFYPRIEPDYSDPNTKINPKQFLLYGVDYLTTNAIRDRFTVWNSEEKKEINVNRIQWINDSLCKITYATEKEAEVVLKQQVPINTKMEDQDGVQKGWLQAKPYTVLFFERPLWIRYSTSEEQSLPKQAVNNFMKYVDAKRMLARFLLQKYNGIKKFEQVVEQIERRKIISRPRRMHHDNGMRDRTRDRRRNNQQQRYNSNQRSFRKNNNNYRQHERHNPRQYRTVHYEQQPYRQNQDFRRGQGNRQFSRQNVEYLDYKQSNNNQPNQNMNLSFTYKKPSGNKSFNQNNNIRKKNCYDSHEINSQYSFNSFGADRINDQSHHLDYVFNENNKKQKDHMNFSINYDYKQGRNIIDTSFNRYDKRQAINQDFNLSFDNRPPPKDKLDLDISIIVPKNKENNKKGGDDFFEYLNSNISPVRVINQNDFNNDSFEYQKGKPDKNKGKGKKDKQQSIYNQDSY